MRKRDERGRDEGGEKVCVCEREKRREKRDDKSVRHRTRHRETVWKINIGVIEKWRQKEWEWERERERDSREIEREREREGGERELVPDMTVVDQLKDEIKETFKKYNFFFD